MTQQEITNIEKELSLKLPAKYIDYLTNYPKELLENETGAPDYELIDDSEKLLEENKNARCDFWGGGPLKTDYFIIGESGTGDYFLMGLADQSIYMFLHEVQKFIKLYNNLDEYVQAILSDQIDETAKKPIYTSDLRDVNHKPEQEKRPWWKIW